MQPWEPACGSLERVGRGLLWGLLILVLCGVSGFGVFSFLQSASSLRTVQPGASARLPVYATVPDFLLLERSGRPIQLADLHGQIWIASFVFTRCTEACPLLTTAMAQLQADFTGADRVRLVSITLDPEHDTVAVLAHYAARFGADPERWLFLTGEKESIYRLARDGFRLSVSDSQQHSSLSAVDEIHPESPTPSPNSGLYPSSVRERPTRQSLRRTLFTLVGPSLALADHGGAKDPVHATRLVLVDGSARIRGYYDGSDPDALLRLRQHMRPLLKED